MNKEKRIIFLKLRGVTIFNDHQTDLSLSKQSQLDEFGLYFQMVWRKEISVDQDERNSNLYMNFSKK